MTHSSKYRGGANTVSNFLHNTPKGLLGTKPAVSQPTNPMAKPLVKKGGKGKKYQGGDAWNWVGSNYGYTTAQQYNNTFSNNGLGMAGNVIPTVHGAKAVGPNNIPQGSNVSYIKQGGQRRCRKRRQSKGGNYGQVLSAAAVPFGLMGANYLLSRRRKQGKFPKARTVRRRSRRKYT